MNTNPLALFWEGFTIESYTRIDARSLLKARGPVKSLLDTGLMIQRETLIHPGEFRVREVAGDLFQHALERERLRRDRGLAILATTASAAPFIGLFGTVWGVYRTLTAISAQQSASLAVVSGPMGEALVATAFGLFVAIPALIAYNSLGRLNSVHHQLLQQLAERLQHSCLYHPQPAERDDETATEAS
ncbi:MotA/TolQ/ExbB proton channel family protein [Hahella sp. SMD15-11]|uniref:Biopolymer transport protein ExbB n=1 Tax=Thermohahella caldifontis TaxID=3142973 RepID=A0AB39UX88_9GAMM